MIYHVITLFPDLYEGFKNTSLIKRASDKKILTIKTYDLRDYASDARKTVDDKPYGGGPGMVIKVDPVYKAVKKIRKGRKIPAIIMSAKGVLFNQKKAVEISREKEIIIICPRYEGYDERIIETTDAREISIGNFILMGGDIAAMAVIEASSRLIPGVLGKRESLENESFSVKNALKHPQYTKPVEFSGLKVPEVLLSGDHKKIGKYREREADKKLRKNRPDLEKGLEAESPH